MRLRGVLMNGCSRRLFIANSVALMIICFGFIMMLIALFFVIDHLGSSVGEAVGINNNRLVFSNESHTAGLGHRKLLQSTGDADDDGGGDMNRIGAACSKDDIVILQGQTAPLPNGIPAYTVEILNACVPGCSISNIHVSCGWFSSARLVNPKVFRRKDFDDCLVNDGEALGPGETLSFQYANSFRYPLSVSSVVCC
ncbi:hypothetical protein PRUPE_4G006300 [Prunus persica]|uniref:Uncharacterized protein n=1 Tax=Prunus persica TaxID=3760 RepID=A0A251PDU4_PRUPE|nr:TPD1 protein homolog 1 [Prunus persica]ONI09738.1 hypothetical protein PRUPE_4G006300 [Prunus persica]